MVEEAEAMREADQKKKEAVEARNNGETLVYQVEKQMTDLKEKISAADSDELKKKLEVLREVMGKDEPEEIQAATKDLQEVSWRVTLAAYQSGSSEGEGDKKEEESDDKFKEEK